jgi:hypothetical protein
MKKRLSGIILAAEIAGIVMLHAFRLSHQERNDKASKPTESLQQANISLSHSYSFFKLK